MSSLLLDEIFDGELLHIEEAKGVLELYVRQK